MVTSDLGRVTTLYLLILLIKLKNCGDVRSRTSYNRFASRSKRLALIVVTSDLGRVTTRVLSCCCGLSYCGDVRSRTSYNIQVR